MWRLKYDKHIINDQHPRDYASLSSTSKPVTVTVERIKKCLREGKCPPPLHDSINYLFVYRFSKINSYL